MTNEQVFAELYYTQKAIKLVTGVTPVHFRPPFGDIDNRVRVIAKSLNLTSILWETDSDDWRINTGSYNTRGTIMLTHELNNFTMSEAIKFLPDLQGAFQHVITVAQGLNVTHPYVEQNVT
jgi:peptidoglycan/xylan/chitin deacetylase (PgdA/CDA1 family)